MKSSERFGVNGSDVAHETIDGEVVIVNLKSGYYYSSDQVGTVIWNLIEKGMSIGEMVDVLAARYDHARGEIEQAARQMIAELQDQGLIVSVQNGCASEIPEEMKQDGEKLEFVPPVLHKYKDMQDLLLLDPIHEVDESGWPNAKRDDDNRA